VEHLEARQLLTTAGLDVVPVNGGPDLVVLGTGDGGADRFVLESQANGNVQVTIRVDEKIDGEFDGNTDFTIIQTFNVPTLEAAASSLGGSFLGFKMEAFGGADKINAKFLKNLERGEYLGGGGNDTLIGGEKAIEKYDAGAGSDDVRRYDNLDISADGGNDGDREDVDTLTLKGDNGVNFDNTTFEKIIGTVKDDRINSSNYPAGRPDGKGVEVNGRDGNDTIIGSDSNDTLAGEKGNDRLVGRGGNDKIGIIVTDQGEQEDPGEGNDTLLGDEGNDTLRGGAGQDEIRGGDGNDQAYGGTENDVLFGDAGNDTLEGQDGNDTLQGGTGNDTLRGGNGTDVADYSDATTGIKVKLSDNQVDPDGNGGKDSLNSIEGILGTDFDDEITGDGNANQLTGGGGDDTINGLEGNDTLDGGGGNDTLVGHKGNDKIDGGNGNDLINGDDFVDPDVDSGFNGDDTINGGGGADTIRGWYGNDVIDGDIGNDSLLGGGGDDMIMGGNGRDTLKGGLGQDYMEGGFNDLTTDIIFFQYDRDDGSAVPSQGGSGPGGIWDFAAQGGLAERDEFIAIRKFDAPDGKVPDDKADPPILVNTGDEIEGDQEFTLEQRADIRQELRNGPNYGNSQLVFTDYDGGDGRNGDVLSFGESQLF
jgi:Ca2+-binding RTX toxin-like protein